MAIAKLFEKLSSAPTNPHTADRPRRFDVADLYQGPLVMSGEAAPSAVPLDEKLRQAYFWIVNTAIISPHYDVEYNDSPPQEYRVGDTKGRLTLPSAQSYSCSSASRRCRGC